MNGPDKLYEYFQQEFPLMKDSVHTYSRELETRSQRTCCTLPEVEGSPLTEYSDSGLDNEDDSDTRFVFRAVANTCTSISSQLLDIEKRKAGPTKKRSRAKSTRGARDLVSPFSPDLTLKIGSISDSTFLKSLTGFAPQYWSDKQMDVPIPANKQSVAQRAATEDVEEHFTDDDGEPTRVDDDEPTPVDDDEPTPVDNDEPTPFDDDEPTPFDDIEPTPVVDVGRTRAQPAYDDEEGSDGRPPFTTPEQSGAPSRALNGVSEGVTQPDKQQTGPVSSSRTSPINPENAAASKGKRRRPEEGNQGGQVKRPRTVSGNDAEDDIEDGLQTKMQKLLPPPPKACLDSLALVYRTTPPPTVSRALGINKKPYVFDVVVQDVRVVKGGKLLDLENSSPFADAESDVLQAISVYTSEQLQSGAVVDEGEAVVCNRWTRQKHEIHVFTGMVCIPYIPPNISGFFY